MRLAAALLAAALLVGSLGVRHAPAAASLSPEPVEVPFAPLAAGSSGGVNGTNASASVAGSLLAATTDLWYVNNTHATLPAYARLAAYQATGLLNLDGLEIGLDNGTRTAQVLGTATGLTQTSGAWVRLAPASVNKVYVTQSVLDLAGTETQVRLVLEAADDESASALVRTRAVVALT